MNSEQNLQKKRLSSVTFVYPTCKYSKDPCVWFPVRNKM